LGYVIARAKGLGPPPRLLLPMPPGPAITTALDATFMVPDEHATSLHLHVALTPTTDDQAGSDADRWRAYHAKAHPSGAWLTAQILAARIGTDRSAHHGLEDPSSPSAVVEGDAIDLDNPLANTASVLIRTLNADRALLARATASTLATPITPADEPVVVGLDPQGLHVRVRAGVLRVALALEPATAQQTLQAWLTTRQ
jgi:hypothetical protein